MTAMVNWLTAMRLFLDHEETDIKRRFGKESPEVEAFEKATNGAFDDPDPGYRFVSKFRSYVQHVGLPLTHIKVGTVSSRETRAKQSIRLVVDRDELLANFDWGARVAPDLRAFPSRFEPLLLISGAMKGLREVQKACWRIELQEAIRHLRY